MLETILFWTFTLVGLINYIHLGLYIMGANLYDIRQVRRKARLSNEKTLYNPLVTVLIPAHNEEAGIIRTLETVSRSTYKNIAVVVVNDASTDKTSKLVEDWIKKRTGFVTSRFVEREGRMVREFYRTSGGVPPTSLVATPYNTGKGGGLNYALHNVVKEGLVMTLDADSALDEHAIENAVSYFRDSKVVGVAANVRIMEQRTVLGILQRFEHMIGYYSKKFYSTANAEFIIGGVASTYRYEVLKNLNFYDTDTSTEDIGLSMKVVAQGNRGQRIVYASDVVASTEGVQTFKALLKQRYRWKMGSLQNLLKYRQMLGSLDDKYSRTLTLYRIPMAFLSEAILITQPIILAYIFYLSFYYQTLGFIFGAYLTITLFVLWTLWPDEHYDNTTKLRLSLYAPAIYFVFYIMDLIQIVSILRCLRNFRRITNRSMQYSTWASPERVGGSI